MGDSSPSMAFNCTGGAKRLIYRSSAFAPHIPDLSEPAYCVMDLSLALILEVINSHDDHYLQDSDKLDIYNHPLYILHNLGIPKSKDPL
jgi:hypothetical protein